MNNDFGIPETGSPLYAATIGVEDLGRSVVFYTEAMGLDVLDRRRLSGRAFETHWRLPAGASAAAAVLGDRDFPVGRLVLLQFDAHGRERVRNIPGQRFFGFVNLNFYVDDIEARTRRLEALGCTAWSRPVLHDMGPAIGKPMEVMVDGPDSVIFNPIELRGGYPEARILRTIAYIESIGGYNRCGTTAVVTSQHCVADYERAMAFNTRVMGMSVRNDTVLQGPHMEHFMQYPPGARSRDTYLQGNHVFGKIAINHPLNFECTNLVPRAVAPNIGYIAQSFRVPSLADSLAEARALSSEIYSEPVEIDLPALGRASTALVRSPGSGALHELIQVL